MNQVTGTVATSEAEENQGSIFNRQTLFESALLFAGVTALLFLLSSRIVNLYDEGILLTGTMRTMAGQVLHRDFYYNYGPAQLYLLAGLFKLVGPSVLAERLADISFANAGLVVTLYVLTRKFCGRALAAGAAMVGLLWAIGLIDERRVSLIPALCTLILWASWLILPVRDVLSQRRRAVGAGVLTAIMFLFRYDLAVGTIAANLVAMVIIRWLEKPATRRSTGGLITSVIGPYLVAFAITVAPAAIAYLSVAPLRDLLYDIVIYTAKYYRVGRELPFPVPRPGPAFGEIAVYLLPVILAISFWVVAHWAIARRRATADESEAPTPEWVNLLVALGVTTAMISMKGLVRASVEGMYGGVMASVLVGAVLVQHRASLNIWLRGLLTGTIALFALAALSFPPKDPTVPSNSLHGPMHLKPMVINWVLTPNRQPPSPAFRDWCDEGTPITRGFCFLLDEDHIQTVRYLNAHTRPGDYLYVGLDRHDRIFINDNITYFAAQRLPATKWSHFDPFLQNREDIQHEMIGELEQRKPPYVVLDSEFDNLREPNGSAVSTGVHLLDDYISAHYRAVQQYGDLTILRRQE